MAPLLREGFSGLAARAGALARRPGMAEPTRGARSRLAAAGAVSLCAWLLLQLLAPPARLPWTDEMREAAEGMALGIQATAAFCRDHEVPVDPVLDPNGTCLVGPEYTPLLTSLGALESKRTTLNPNLAGLLVHLLREAGVSRGARVAVGASGSFPGFLLATLVAVEALGAQPVTILSLGASSYGATRPDLHLLDLHDLWRREGVVTGGVAAVSLGGGGDVGGEFDAPTRASLIKDILQRGLPLIQEPELVANVAARMEAYGPVAAFVNVGGAQANLGTSPLILQLPPGLNWALAPPALEERGVLFEMGARGIPVIHLLHVRGLAQRFGLPWDPVPTPAPGRGVLLTGAQGGGLPFWFLTAGYLAALLLVFLFPSTVRLSAE